MACTLPRRAQAKAIPAKLLPAIMSQAASASWRQATKRRRLRPIGAGDVCIELLELFLFLVSKVAFLGRAPKHQLDIGVDAKGQRQGAVSLHGALVKAHIGRGVVGHAVRDVGRAVQARRGVEVGQVVAARVAVDGVAHHVVGDKVAVRMVRAGQLEALRACATRETRPSCQSSR